MNKSECPYCQRNEEMQQLGLVIADLSVSTLFLFREQSHPGRCIVAFKDHVSEIFQLSVPERHAFMDDLARSAEAIHKAYGPQKINYGAYGDLYPHLHFHLVPKYRDAFEWGGTFAMNPRQVYLSAEEYAAAIAKVKSEL